MSSGPARTEERHRSDPYKEGFSTPYKCYWLRRVINSNQPIETKKENKFNNDTRLSITFVQSMGSVQISVPLTLTVLFY